jgi:cold shock CspA family protein
MRGEVISYDAARGFGFLMPSQPRADGACIWFKATGRFKKGDAVEYASGPYRLRRRGTARGPTAKSVKLVEPTSAAQRTAPERIETIYGESDFEPWSKV